MTLCQENAEQNTALQNQNNELVPKSKNLKANHAEDRKLLQGLEKQLKDWKIKCKAAEN